MWTTFAKIILKVRPDAGCCLQKWKLRATAIPDPELRKQALASIENKAFHCEGGAIYALLAGNHYPEALRFIIAYQTISDYLDNLCDRSTSTNEDDFRALHESMLHALTPGKPPVNYYRFRPEQNDGGYLADLVKTCQDVLQNIPDYSRIAPPGFELAHYYIDLQVYKHIQPSERIPRLQKWFEDVRGQLPGMSWYEFGACAGSTLGIFCLVAQSFSGCSPQLAENIKRAYFPWVQGLHILLDYFIDQAEDRDGGDLNFCSFYPDESTLEKRLTHFYRQAESSITSLPGADFHSLINRGLLGMYLSDPKVSQQKNIEMTARRIVRLGGPISRISFLFYRLFHRLQA